MTTAIIDEVYYDKNMNEVPRDKAYFVFRHITEDDGSYREVFTRYVEEIQKE